MKRISTLVASLFIGFGLHAQHSNWYNIVPNQHKANDISVAGGTAYIASDAGYVTIDNMTGTQSYYTINNTDLFRSKLNEIYVNSTGEIWMNNDGKLASLDANVGTLYPYYLFSNAKHIVENDQGVVYMISYGGLTVATSSGYEHYNDGNSIFDIPSLTPTSMALDSNGELWIAQYGKGLYHFDGSNFTLYDMNNSSLPGLDLESITVADNGNVYMGSYTHGLIEFDGTNWTIYNSQNSGLTATYISELEHDGNTIYGIVHNNGVSEILKLEAGQLSMINSSNSSLPLAQYQFLEVDNAGALWFQSVENENYAILQFDGTTLNTHLLQESVLKSDKVLDIALGENGNVSFTNYNETYTTMNLIDENNNQFTVNNSNTGDSKKVINHGSASLIYGGTDEVVVFENGVFTTYNSTNTGIPLFTVIDAATDVSGNVWLATQQGLIKYDGTSFSLVHTFSGSTMNNLQLLEMDVDHSGNFWLIASMSGTVLDGELISFDGTNYTTYNSVTNTQLNYDYFKLVTVSTDGVIYTIPAQTDVVMKIQGGSFSTHTNVAAYTTNSTVNVLTVKDDKLLIGTTSAGVVYRNANGYTYLEDINTPLISNNITSIVIDDYNNIWIGTEEGMSVYNENGVTVNTDELLSKETESGVVLYPNPFTSQITIKVKEASLESDLLVYNINGKLLKRVDINQVEQSIDLDQYQSGVYFYSIVKNGVVLNSGKLMKQ